jgi:hypothetical protein
MSTPTESWQRSPQILWVEALGSCSGHHQESQVMALDSCSCSAQDLRFAQQLRERALKRRLISKMITVAEHSMDCHDFDLKLMAPGRYKAATFASSTKNSPKMNRMLAWCHCTEIQAVRMANPCLPSHSGDTLQLL